jgi:hypothetical protein
MNLGMTVDTGNGGEVTHPMTLKTETLNIAADQKKPVGRSVDGMTDTAPLGLNGQVFENPGASLLRMALKACIVTELAPFPEVGSGSRSMRGMAIRAFDRPFKDFMPRRKIKLGLHILMTGETEVGLRGFQEVLGDLGGVNLVAIIACNGTQFVNTSIELEKLFLIPVTFQTHIGTIFCSLTLKREDESLALGLCMLFPGTMTGFASLLPGRNLGVFDTTPVRVILFEAFIEIPVALLTDLGPGVLPFFSFLTFLAEGCEDEEGYQNCQGTNQRQNPSRIHK